jgi:hypothetical protein
MLAADAAEILLARVHNDPAKPTPVKMRTSLPRTEHKVRRAVSRDALPDSLAIAAEHLIFFKRAIINVYLPTDTAAVRTAVGNAFEFLIILWCVKLHNFSFAVYVMGIL